MNPPSAYSAEQPDFDSDLGARIIVLRDGVPVRDVVAYDCEAGWVEVVRRDSAGNYVVIDDEWHNVVLTGVISAQFKSDGQ